MRAFHGAGERAERRGLNVLRVSFGPKRAHAGPAESTELVRLWFEPPARIRAETEGERGSSTVVTDGTHEWRLRDGRAVRGPAKPPHEAVDALFLLRPWMLLPSYHFEPLGRTTVAGREAIAVRAHLRPADGSTRMHVDRLSWGADEHLLAVDSDQGILLRLASILDDREFNVTEMTGARFDEPIEPDRFRFEPPPDVEILTAEEEIRRLNREFPKPHHPTGTETMGTQVTFTVFALSPEGPPITDRSTTYRDDHIFHSFTLLLGDEEHRVVLLQRAADGEVWSNGGHPDQVRVSVQRDGTRVDASSWTLDAVRLRQVVDALEPVETR